MNESIGILSETGGGSLVVMELTGGCLCCTLTSGLISAVEEIYERYGVEYMIVESGIMTMPDRIIEMSNSYLPEVKDITTIYVMDADEAADIFDTLETSVSNQLRYTDYVVLSGCDKVPVEERTAVKEKVLSYNGRIKVLQSQHRVFHDAVEIVGTHVTAEAIKIDIIRRNKLK